MVVYRISQTKYARHLTASGIDARWNSFGQLVIYTGGSAALSCLEILAHKSGTSLASGDFSISKIEFPDDLPIKTISINELTAINTDWQTVENYPITQEIGDKWIKDGEFAVLKVPSAIIEMEHNYLLNPRHPDFYQIKIMAVNKFAFDNRLKFY